MATNKNLAYVSQTADYGDESALAVVALDLTTGGIKAATPAGILAPLGFPTELALSANGDSLVVAADGYGLRAPVLNQ